MIRHSMKNRRQQISLTLLCIYIIAVCLLCFSDLSHISSNDFNWEDFPIDKLFHFLMFVPFPILAFYSLDNGKFSTTRSLLHIVTIFLTGSTVAYGTEVIQSFTESRSYEIMDFAADLAGLTCGSVFIVIILIIKKIKRNAE